MWKWLAKLKPHDSVQRPIVSGYGLKPFLCIFWNSYGFLTIGFKKKSGFLLWQVASFLQKNNAPTAIRQRKKSAVIADWTTANKNNLKSYVFTRAIPLRTYTIPCLSALCFIGLSWEWNLLLFTPLVRSKHAKYLPKRTDSEVIICYCNRNCCTSNFHSTTPQVCAAFGKHVDRWPGVELERAQLRFPEAVCSFLHSQMKRQVNYYYIRILYSHDRERCDPKKEGY